MLSNLGTNSTLSSVESELVDYFQENPGASDSAQGIRRWWLYRQRAKQSNSLVTDALEELVNKRVLEKLETQSGNTIYRLFRQ